MSRSLRSQFKKNPRSARILSCPIVLTRLNTVASRHSLKFEDALAQRDSLFREPVPWRNFSGSLDTARYNACPCEFPLPGDSHAKGEQSHETCGQDGNPDGRVGLRVRGRFRSGGTCRRRADSTVWAEIKLPEVEAGRVTCVTAFKLYLF
jgi:hypothetical protein